MQQKLMNWGVHVNVACFIRSSAICTNLTISAWLILVESSRVKADLKRMQHHIFVLNLLYNQGGISHKEGLQFDSLYIYIFPFQGEKLLGAEFVRFAPGPRFIAGIIRIVDVLDAALQGRNAPGQQHGVSSDKTIQVWVEDKKLYMIIYMVVEFLVCINHYSFSPYALCLYYWCMVLGVLSR